MRKYLLLASVAGCLMANNAMAGSPSEDGQSIVVGAKAELVTMSTITSATDMDFGVLAIDSSDDSSSVKKIATLSTAGIVTRDDTDYVISTGGTPAVTLVNITGTHHTDIEIECISDGGLGGYCALDNGSGLWVKDFTVDKTNPNQYKVGASLYALPMDTKEFYNAVDYNPTAFRVTLKY